MYKIAVFAGTSEGRTLIERLSGRGLGVTAFVATEYGEVALGRHEGVETRTCKHYSGHKETRDIPALLALLSQVLELHAKIRPDIFVPGTTKYTETALAALLAEEEKPVYVAVDAVDRVLGYAFCVLKHAPAGGFIRPHTALYIDDLCVDEAARGRSLGRMLFQHVTAEARRLGCYEITLNVWEGNDSARRFYESLGMSPKSTQMELIL